MPEDIIHSPIFQRETRILTEPGQYVYTERAILEIKIQNEEQEKKLTDWSYITRIDGFKMWEGVEILFHISSLHECQKCKMSGRPEKGHHDDWCNIKNQKIKNPNNQYPQKPSSNSPSGEKNDNQTTSDKFCNGSENVEGKNVETPSTVLINEFKTNIAASHAMFRYDRQSAVKKKGGGVLLYIPVKLAPKLRPDLNLFDKEK